MSAADDVLSRLVAWASEDANVRRLVLVGSRARGEAPDELADIDVQVYASSSERYTLDDAWLSGIGRTWLCIRDEYADGGILVPTRLVIFDRGVKVDFAFYPADVLSDGIRAGFAHRILLDKEGAPGMPRPESLPPARRREPTEAEFSRAVDEFWFEAYHVAKYLSRNELWQVKSRDWATKQLLLKFIEWHARPAQGGDHDIYDEGKGMRSWVGDRTWEALRGTFAGFDREEGWSALLATMDLFRRLAMDTAARLGFVYPVEVDRNVSEFIIGLRRGDSIG